MKKIYIILCISLLSFPYTAFCETPQEKGLAIAVEGNRRDNGFGDFTADMEMTLKDRHGNISTRNIRSKTLEVKSDGDKSLSIFLSPADVKGTAMLTYSHKTGSDDQWLYLPALKRVKRISSSNKSGSFMGSEFAFEDISSQEVEKFTYKWLRDEQYNGQSCFVIEFYPADKKSGYTREVVWIEKKEYRVQKINFFDRKNSPLKTLLFSDYNQYVNQYWRPGKMQMDNHQTGKSTTLIWKNYKFKTGLSNKDFHKNSLKRAR